jgi:hypothetical protein
MSDFTLLGIAVVAITITTVLAMIEAVNIIHSVMQ